MASLYDLITSANSNGSRKPIGEWNHGMLRVYPDGKKEHWLNNYKVIEYQRGTPEFYALAKSKYKDWPDFGKASKGRIMLQHGDHVSFRSIKLKDL